MDVYTIGFTKRSAESFFSELERNGITRLVDVRLNNSSQLAGFTKRDDLAYFLDRIGGIAYVHEPRLAPTQEIIDAYRKRKGPWSDFETSFLALMAERKIEDVIPRDLFDGCTVLLCSEPEAERCHRSLVLDYLAERWGDITPVHL